MPGLALLAGIVLATAFAESATAAPAKGDAPNAKEEKASGKKAGDKKKAR